MQIKCNIFKTLFRNAGIVALSFICERIRSGYYANAIKVLREAIAQGDNLLADRLKKALDAFTVSALYNGARKLEHMVKYIGLIVLDFDNIDPAAIPDLKRRAAEMKETIVAFISPSGRGLKIICRPYVSWALTLANHVRTFLFMAALYLETLGIAADGSGKDPGRLCFVSDDAGIFFDPSRLEGFEEGVLGVEEGIGVQGTGYGEEEKTPEDPPTAEAEPPVPHTPNPEPRTP